MASEIILATGVAPSAPSASTVALYAKTDGLLYSQDSSGNEKSLGGWSYLAEQASTSGTSLTFSGIPSGITDVEFMLVGVSTNGTSALITQIGDSGGIVSTSYVGSVTNITGGTSANFSSGFALNVNPIASTTVQHGSVKLRLENSTNNTWVMETTLGASNSAVTWAAAGSRALSSSLSQVRITTLAGTDTFDAGVVRVRYR